MRVIAAMALAACLAAGAPAQARPNSELGAFTVPPPVSVQRLPGDAPVRPVRFSKIAIHLRDGEPWAEVRYELFSQLDDPLVWNGGRAELKVDAFERIFSEEFTKAGFKIDGDPYSLFADESAGDLKIGVLVPEMKGRFCYTCGLTVAPQNWVKGAVLMSAQWQVYSTMQRTVIATFSTVGGYETGEAAPDNELRIIYAAFRENVRALLENPEFRALVTAPSPSLSPASTASQSPIVFKPAAAGGKRPIAQASDAVVAIFAGDGMGSGFLISQEGYLITNQHVVGGSKFVKVKWSDGTESLGEVVRTNRPGDVALVKTDARDREPLVLRRSPPELGDTVFAIGTPLEEKFQSTLTKGVVSANRTLEGNRYIQSDVAVDHGNSGGPLLDEEGRVVAITQWGYSPDNVSHDLNFFIPIGDALDFLALKPAS